MCLPVIQIWAFFFHYKIGIFLVIFAEIGCESERPAGEIQNAE